MTTTTKTIITDLGENRPRVMVEINGPGRSSTHHDELYEDLIPDVLAPARTGLSVVTMLGLHVALALQEPDNQRRRLCGDPIMIPRPGWLDHFGGAEALEANLALTEALQRHGLVLNQAPDAYYVSPA